MAECSDSSIILSQSTEVNETDENGGAAADCDKFVERGSDLNQNGEVERLCQNLPNDDDNHQGNSTEAALNLSTEAGGTGSDDSVTNGDLNPGLRDMADETEETEHIENDRTDGNVAHSDGDPADCDEADCSGVSDCGNVQYDGSEAENASDTANAENNHDLEGTGNDNDAKDSAEDNNEPDNVDIANGQRTLSGPHRRRQMIRGQNRHDPLAHQQRRIALPAFLMARWREVGNEWGLQDDDDIARVLVRHYEDLSAGRPPRPPPRPRCRGCGEVLVPLPCEACGPSHHANRLFHDSNHRGAGGGGGKGGFCGRC